MEYEDETYKIEWTISQSSNPIKEEGWMISHGTALNQRLIAFQVYTVNAQKGRHLPILKTFNSPNY